MMALAMKSLGKDNCEKKTKELTRSRIHNEKVKWLAWVVAVGRMMMCTSSHGTPLYLISTSTVSYFTKSSGGPAWERPSLRGQRPDRRSKDEGSSVSDSHYYLEE